MNKYNLIVTTTFGLEAVAARELRNLGYNEINVDNGRIDLEGTVEDIAKLNISLRTAERVFINMGEFKALTFDELFEKTKAIEWEKLLPKDAMFPVSGKSVKSKLFSVSDCQAIVKKAIVERLKTNYKKSWFDEDGPRYKIEVGLLKDIATITVDTSGVGLHKRGYRKQGSDAPLKETLAAALIQLSFWDKDRLLVDPFCGSGTLLIEAALIGKNIAPGINRDFDFVHWYQCGEDKFNEIKSELKAAANGELDFKLQGYDIDTRALSTARHNAKLAGVEEDIDFHARDIKEFSSKRKYGVIITNPPYGERLGQIREAEKLYRTMGDRFKSLDTWSIYVLTSDEEFEKCFGKKADRKRKLYNGRIKVDYYQYYGPRPPRKE